MGAVSNGRRLRVLLVAEAANPEWVSVPLVGWSHARAIAQVVDAHVVTSTRNGAAIERAGWREGREHTLIDNERVAAPMWKFNTWVRKATGLGWTAETALSVVPYYYFEQLVWRRFGAAIRGGEFDLVHRITPLTPTTPSLLAGRCRKAGVPFVLGPLNGGVPWPPGFLDVVRHEGEWLSYVRDAYKLLPGYRATRRDAAAILAGSRATLEQLGEHKDKAIYLPENAIDPARFPAPPARDEARLGGPLRVAFLGRLVPYKGADMLVEAAAPLVREGLLTVEILGDGPQRPELERLIAREQVGAGVKLAGWVPHGEVRDRLVGAEVFAFPSIREFGGGVVLEAMALGLVPVVVDYAGPSELVTASTGVRVPVGPRPVLVGRLREVLGSLASNRGRLPGMGARARERVLTQFTWEAKARQVLKVYDWVLGRGPRPDFGMPLPDLTDTSNLGTHHDGDAVVRHSFSRVSDAKPLLMK